MGVRRERSGSVAGRHTQERMSTQAPEPITAFAKVTARALRMLGDAGEKEKACELAAEAWSVLRADYPKEAERMNGVLHYLTANKCSRKESDVVAKDFDLEVRDLVPARRHELIFETYHKLEPGQGFILINDHDPKPLYYQFAFEHKDQFTWEPIEQGPEVWRVRIGKP